MALFHKFQSAYGLQLNTLKTEIFLAGYDEAYSQQIVNRSDKGCKPLVE